VEPLDNGPADLQIMFTGRDFGGQTIHADARVSLQISARVVDRAGLEMMGSFPVEFTSRDTSVVTVDAGGLITARKAGTSVVVARLPMADGALMDSVRLTYGCAAAFGFGLEVALKDSLTNEIPSVASSWRVRDIAGTYADSGRTMAYFFSAGERAGTYRIEITTPGYRDWTADNVIVGRDQCRVKLVALTARLQPTR
jgi:hypothetical protein